MRPRSGYTVVEMMIVLAVSGAMFVSAIALMSGKASKTGFGQAVQDISSKIQAEASSIKSGTFDNPEGYDCSVDGSGNATLVTGTGINNNCIVLGRAFQSNPSWDYINIYTVLGNRLATNGQVANSLTTNPNRTIPNAAYALTDQYFFGGAANIISVRSGGAGDYSLLSVYASPDSGRFVSVAQRAGTNENNPALTLCVRNAFSTGSCNAITPVTSWEICMAEPGGTLRRQITVTVTAAGVNSEVKDAACT